MQFSKLIVMGDFNVHTNTTLSGASLDFTTAIAINSRQLNTLLMAYNPSFWRSFLISLKEAVVIHLLKKSSLDERT